MSRRTNTGAPREPERYELGEPRTYGFALGELPRRDFFKALGGGVLIVLMLKRAWAQQERGGRGRRLAAGEIGAWLHIAEDGAVTAYTGKVEVGQDIRTSLTQAVAEELHVPAASLRLVMGDTDQTPYDMGTFGSRTTPHMNLQLRKAAAAARETLIELAAARLNVERESLRAADGQVVHSVSQRALSYGELSRGRNLVKAIGEARLKRPSAWQTAGRALPKIAGGDMITGKHRYTPDLKRPGMLYARVLRPATLGASLAALDTSAAEKLPGVTVVRDGDFVGVVAPGEHQAARALAAIRSEWKSARSISNEDLYRELRGQAAGASAAPAPFTAFGGAGLESTYTIAYVAHAPLEPRAAVAEWRDGRLTVWTGTQRPFGVRSELAGAFGIAEERVRVIVPDTGSGYGGKHTGEVAVEAARLARATGKPVKLMWSREEEFTWAYFRPAGVIDIKSRVGANGAIAAWELHNYNSGSSGIRSRYAIADERVHFHPARSPLRQGSYRGLAATANHFAREVHMDELAHLVKMDPLAFRLANLEDDRLRAVLQAAAKALRWGLVKVAPARGLGIACGFEKGGYIANCVEVAADRAASEVKLVRVATAFECGAIVNPEGLKNQVEGAVIQGLGGALFETVKFAEGKILNARFSSYRVPRFSDLPELETILLDRQDLASAGAGETPIVALAPAIGNAIFAATGIRLSSMPLVPDGLVSGR